MLKKNLMVLKTNLIACGKIQTQSIPPHCSFVTLLSPPDLHLLLHGRIWWWEGLAGGTILWDWSRCWQSSQQVEVTKTREQSQEECNSHEALEMERRSGVSQSKRAQKWVVKLEFGVVVWEMRTSQEQIGKREGSPTWIAKNNCYLWGLFF